jgi:hypothetical protein
MVPPADAGGSVTQNAATSQYHPRKRVGQTLNVLVDRWFHPLTQVGRTLKTRQGVSTTCVSGWIKHSTSGLTNGPTR